MQFCLCCCVVLVVFVVCYGFEQGISLTCPTELGLEIGLFQESCVVVYPCCCFSFCFEENFLSVCVGEGHGGEQFSMGVVRFYCNMGHIVS